MSQKKKSAFGVQFTGKVTFQGPMFDIHDNEHVHLETARFIKPGNVEEVEEDEELEMATDIMQPPVEEELNYFQPRLHLKRLLEMEWFGICRTKPIYTQKWIEGLVDGLLDSQWKDEIAREWSYPKKRASMKGYLMGVLKDTGVLKGSYDSISMVAHIINNTRTYSRYMSMGKKQKWFTWVADYVKNK